jgi:two-component system, OmpR family, phosphate regulon response regulator PhoB
MPANDTHKQILIVDRDVGAVEPLRQMLCDAGFAARVIADPAAAAVAVVERPPHLVIIDWTSPGYAALELIGNVRRVRVPHAIRLILLSTLSSEHDVVAGFDLGADDYIEKPFSLREVAARVSAVLRSHTHENRSPVISSNEVVLDRLANRVTVCGQLLSLRGAEYRLLEFLMSHPGTTFNRTQLLAEIWDGDLEIGERTIDVTVRRLRKVLIERGIEPRIQTVRGFGYRFATDAEARTQCAAVHVPLT